MSLPEILIVGQNRVNSGYMKTYLEAAGFQVETVGNVREGLKSLIHKMPDLLIIDYTADEDIEFCRQIRRLTDLPIIILGQNQQNMCENTALDAGADDYFARPFSIKILVLKISNILKRRRPAEATGPCLADFSISEHFNF